MIADRGEVEFFECEVGALDLVVVAGDAILVEQRALGCRRRRARCSRRSRCGTRRRGCGRRLWRCRGLLLTARCCRLSGDKGSKGQCRTTQPKCLAHFRIAPCLVPAVIDYALISQTYFASQTISSDPPIIFCTMIGAILIV